MILKQKGWFCVTSCGVTSEEFFTNTEHIKHHDRSRQPVLFLPMVPAHNLSHATLRADGIIWLPWWLSGKESCQCKRREYDPWVRKISWRRKWQPTPVFLPGEFHGRGNLAGYSPWGHTELVMTEHTHICICIADSLCCTAETNIW